MKDPIAIYFVEKIQITLASKATLSLIINSENGSSSVMSSSNKTKEQIILSQAILNNGLPQIQIIEETEEEDFDRVDDLLNSDLKSRKVCAFIIIFTS